MTMRDPRYKVAESLVGVHHDYYDTVLVTMPTAVGAEWEMFRACEGKGKRVANVYAPQRLPAKHQLTLEGIVVNVSHWGGDDFTSEFNRLASLRFKVNERVVYDGPVDVCLYGYEVSFPGPITDVDDIRATFSLPGLPPGWDPPSKWVEEPTTEQIEESLFPSGLLHRVADKFGFDLMRKTVRTVQKKVRREKWGQLAVRFAMRGRAMLPVSQ